MALASTMIVIDDERWLVGSLLVVFGADCESPRLSNIILAILAFGMARFKLRMLLSGTVKLAAMAQSTSPITAQLHPAHSMALNFYVDPKARNLDARSRRIGAGFRITSIW